MRDITPRGLLSAGLTTLQRAQGNLLVHATECLAGGTLDFLVLATHELAQLGVRQVLLFSRRADTPHDLGALFPPTLRLVEVPAARGHHMAFVRAFAATLRHLVFEYPVGAVHLHSSKAGFVGRLALALGRGDTRLIYSPHGLSFVNRRRRSAAALFWLLERLAATVGCQYVGCSDSEALALARLTGRTAYLLENPVDARFFEIESQAREDEPLIITCGRICEQKSPEDFAELAVRIRVEVPHARFVWIGDGEPDRAALLRAADVEITGWVGAETVRRWMAQATLYVQTSRWEGMPMSVIQAMAAGLPCVVTDVVGNRDAVIDGETGFVAAGIDELAAHVELLLREPTLRASMQAPSRALAARRFGRQRFRESLINLYELRDTLAPRVEPARSAAGLGS